MFESLLTQPQLIELPQDGYLVLTLSDSASDHSLLQTTGGHIAEWVVVESTYDRVSLLARIHPFLKLDIQSTFIGEVNNSSTAEQINRTSGQGVRLFNAIGYSPAICVSLLRQGLVIKISYEQASVNFLPLFDKKWQLIELERDLRLFGAPKELRRANAILAREPDLLLNAEKLLLEISEIEIVRNELRAFVNERQIHDYRTLLNEVTNLDTQLLRRKQLISRQYHQSLERVNWQYAANYEDDIEVLQRKIESYRLLSPPELNAMVEQMFVDENE
ncbi:hypothetical protein [Shewanella psychrotolerans]|uniref:hypothetical protein n=1 Tax=Shewanella psychrotolerans TaxID=2864206 RepID=UPI001C655697|nr:hypothetical protein [Shewanella psychrotolerans]QYK00117.1 hypothetical protein K0I62_11780 [Shewanella psychrotolerans]